MPRRTERTRVNQGEIADTMDVLDDHDNEYLYAELARLQEIVHDARRGLTPTEMVRLHAVRALIAQREWSRR